MSQTCNFCQDNRKLVNFEASLARHKKKSKAFIESLVSGYIHSMEWYTEQ